MKNSKIVLEYDDEKLDALNIFIKEKGTTVDEELMDALEKLYEKIVPQNVKVYIDSKKLDTKGKPKKKDSIEVPKFKKPEQPIPQ